MLRRTCLPLLAILMSGLSPALADTWRPKDDAMVLATVPAGLGGGSGFRAAEAAARLAPNDLDAAIRFARAAIEEGRTRSDPRFYGRAEAALAPWWTSRSTPPEVRILRAVIRQAGHDFSGALTDLDALIADRPLDAQARLSRAAIRIVTGNITGAGEDCDEVRPVGGPLPGLICRARIAALTGDGERALAALQRATLMLADADPAQLRFARLVSAEILAGIGRGDEADTVLKEIGPDVDVPTLAARAELLLDLDRPTEVLTLLDGAGEADVLLLARVRAAARTGDSRAATWTALLQERFAAASAAGVTLHRREEARFRLSVLGDPTGALVLARDNWAVQKEVTDTRLLLEAAIAAGEPAEAREALAFIRDTRLEDARLRPLIARLQGDI